MPAREPESIRSGKPTVTRGEVDACPGALRLHPAADGPLARVRLPGGLLTGAQLTELAALAEEFGDAHLELTSRANLQLRALTGADPSVLAARLSAAGLLPSETHETVRNIAAPPLAGATLRTLVAALDRALCADPALAALPGRFLFAIGELPLTADVAAVPLTATAGTFTIRFAGHDFGLHVPVDTVVPTLLEAASVFLTARAGFTPPAWRLHELPDGPALVAGHTASALGLPRPSAPHPPPGQAPDSARRSGHVGSDPSAPFVGVVPQGDGLVAVGALVPLGRLGGAALRLLTTARRLEVTPWRGVVVPDLTPEAARRWARALAEAGLPVEPTTRWAGVTACAGRPGCAKSLADVRADADSSSAYSDGLPVHWIGCPRGCGSPSGAHVRVEATPAGYAVTRQPDGQTFTGDTAHAVAAARRS